MAGSGYDGATERRSLMADGHLSMSTTHGSLGEFLSGLGSLLKSQPTAGDVHVDGFVDSKKPKKPKKWKPGDPEAMMTVGKECRIAKVAPELGLVFGWGIICKMQGQDYYDLNIDKNGERVPEHIPEDAMLEAAADFMGASMKAREMHKGDQIGKILFAFPLTTEIAKAMKIETDVTGLMLAMKPDDPAVLAKFKSGEYTGFSIGGSRLETEDVEIDG